MVGGCKSKRAVKARRVSAQKSVDDVLRKRTCPPARLYKSTCSMWFESDGAGYHMAEGVWFLHPLRSGV